jgi:hypothetical protein
MTDNVPKVLSLLRYIVERSAKTPNEDDAAVQTRLDGFLAEGFDRLDFHNLVRSIAKVERVDSEDRRTVVYFDDADGWQQRALFELSTDNVWKLVSLKFQCTICVGSGKNDGQECILCDGNGWEQEPLRAYRPTRWAAW